MQSIDYSKQPNMKVLCVDLKSFYASVEAVELGLDPLQAMVAVASDLSRKGSVILAATQKLKDQYGIKTGSRLYEIPDDKQIHIVKARMGLYLDKSMHVTHITSRFAPVEAISIYSIDEYFMSCLGLEKLFGPPEEVALLIKRAIYKELGLLAAVGIGPNKFLAKFCLDNYAKKTGLATINYEHIPDLVWPLPIEAMWGVGRRMKSSLNQIGIRTIGDLAHTSIDLLQRKFGVMGQQLYYHSLGIDLSPVMVDPRDEYRKGFSHGVTLMRDYNHDEIKVVMYELTDMLASKLRRYQVAATTVSISLRYSYVEDTPSFGKSKTLYGSTNLSIQLYKACLELLKEDRSPSSRIRHISIGVSNLIDETAIQVDLFDAEYHEKLRRLGRVTDRIIAKFGPTSILRATSITGAGILLDRAFKIGGHYE